MLSYERWVASGETIEVDLVGGKLARIFRRRAGEAGGAPIVFVHGFPTSSWDYSKIEPMLEDRYELFYLDLLGFGASEKPRTHRYELLEQADIVEKVVASFGLREAHLVVHDYGVSIGQELLARSQGGRLPFVVKSMAFLNGGLYSHLHRPLLVQRLLRVPLVGAGLARAFDYKRFCEAMRQISPEHPPSDDDLSQHWAAISANGGATIAHRLIHYIRDREVHGAVWTKALEGADIPLAFVWGMRDPISGAHVIEYVEPRLARAAAITRLADVGHYPQVEARGRVAAALSAFWENYEANGAHAVWPPAR